MSLMNENLKFITRERDHWRQVAETLHLEKQETMQVNTGL